MNTKPKAKKFRVRRSAILANDGKDAERAAQAEAAEKALQSAQTSTQQSIPVSQLSARQLRMAGRLAERKGLKVGSDEEALKALRDRGIDPFTQNRLEIVPPKKDVPKVPAPSQERKPGGKQLPVQAETAKVPAPAKPQQHADQRAEQIIKMQRDIARRRRRNLVGLWFRIAAFVLAPTFAAWYYFSNIASPLYSTYADFIIQQSDNPAAGGMAGMFSGTSLANSQDSITVQSYLTSRGAMLRLEEEVGFREHFVGDDIDVLQRIDDDATNESVYKQFKKSVKIGYDPTEGLIRMEVIAPDPQVGLEISEALLKFAESEVDALNRPIRRDQMAGAEQSLQDAEDNMARAQQRVLDLQQARGVLNADAEVSMIMGQISTFEVMLQEERLSLQSLMDNARPNQTKVDVANREIARIERVIADMRAQLTADDNDGLSLAKITGELVIAQAELETRQLMLSQALQQLEAARVEANRQVRYLLQGVRPTLSDEPSYPRVFENTLLAFVIFAGLYLMASLTMSVLREQVSS